MGEIKHFLKLDVSKFFFTLELAIRRNKSGISPPVPAYGKIPGNQKSDNRDRGKRQSGSDYRKGI